MILFTHHTGEPHGILGAQSAATFFQEELSIPSIVVGIKRNFSKENLLRFIDEYYTGKKRIVCFSHLCGRKDLIGLIHELKQEGFTTILGGPQARQDYEGEPGADIHPHRFMGLRSKVDICFHGPVDGLRPEHLNLRNQCLSHPWTTDISLKVDWRSLYTFSDALNNHEVQLGQVLHAIGCPYSRKMQAVRLPPPADLRERGVPEITIRSGGCAFCDVSRDRGFHGPVERHRVMTQIEALPGFDGRKIPFELIDEYPLRSLGSLLEAVDDHGIKLSQIRGEGGE